MNAQLITLTLTAADVATLVSLTGAGLVQAQKVAMDDEAPITARLGAAVAFKRAEKLLDDLQAQVIAQVEPESELEAA